MSSSGYARDMSYGLIGTREGIATREDTRAEDSSFRFVKLDQYLDETEMSGIPQPPVRKNLHSFVHFAIAVLLLLLCTVGIYLHNGVYDTINLSEGSEQINIHVSGCDVLFRPVKPGEIPGLHYRTWNFMGKAHVEVADGTIDLHLMNSHRMPLFHCNAVFRLQPGTEITNELHIVQTGGYAAILTEQDEGENSLLVVGRTARFDMEHVQCQLSKLEVPKADILIERGLLELTDPDVADLTVGTVSAPVSLVSHKRPVQAKLPKAIADHCALYAGELDVQDGDIMDVILSPRGAKGPVNSAIVANMSTQQAPIAVLCGKEDDDLQSHKGEHHLTPKLIAGASAIRNLESFVEDSKGLPYIVNVRVIGFGLPQGLWQMMSTTAYLALSVDWLVLLSFGALKPRVFEVSVHALGLGLDAETDDVFEVLWDKLGHVFAHSTIAWVPTERSKPALLYEYDGKDYRKRHVANSDIIGFMISLVLNLAGAVAVVAYLARFCLTIVYPYVMARQCERTITKCASHRLCLAGSQDTWQLSACRVPFNPSAGVRQAGVLLRWKRRKNYMLFSRYSIRCQSEGHRFTLPINKQSVMPSANNPSQLELFIPLVQPGTSQKMFKVGISYKFQVVGVGLRGAEVQTSTWSSLVYISPAVPFTDFPLMLLKVFAGQSDEKLSSMDLFCDACVAQKNTSARIMLHNLYLDLHSTIFAKLQDMVEDGLDIIMSAEWEGENEQDSTPILSLDDDFERKGQFHRNKKALQLTITRSSAEQQFLILRLGTKQGEMAFQVSVKFSELAAQWEKQFDYYATEAEKEVTLFNVPRCCGPRETKGVGPDMPWWREIPFEHRRSGLMKSPAGCKLSCWVAFGHSDPYRPDSGHVRWLQYPQTAYAMPDDSTAGTPLPMSLSWPRATIRGIYPNEVILQGTRKVLYFSEELDFNGMSVDLIHLELRPSFTSEVNLFQRILTEDAIEVSGGSFIWDVKFVDEGDHDMNDRFVLIAHIDGTEYLAASVEFLIVRPVLLSEFELGYASFCRSYELPMESLEDLRLEDSGIHVSTLPLMICEGLRMVLPAERYSKDRRRLRFCVFEGSMVPSARPIILEEDKALFRCALRMVKVLDGTHWRHMHQAFTYDLLMAYNFDYSFAIANFIKVPKLRWLIRHLLEIFLYLVQILSFTIPPLSAFMLLVLHQFLHSKMCFSYYAADPRKAYLTDWLYSPSHISTLREQTPGIQLAVFLIFMYMFIVMGTLLYMNFMRSRNLKLDNLVNLLTLVMIGAVTFVYAVLVCMGLLWVGLAALINPHDVLPFAVMICSAVFTAKRLVYTLTKVQVRVQAQVDYMSEKVMSIMLDDFVQSQVDAAFQGTIKEEELDPDKAKFVRSLCDLGEAVRAPRSRPGNVVSSTDSVPLSSRATGRVRASSIDEEGLFDEEEEDAEEDEEEFLEEEPEEAAAIAGTGGFSQAVRKKLDICFHHIVAKLPLPQGIQQCLRHPQQLAHSCVDKRAEGLRKLVGPEGETLLRDLAERTLDMRLMDAMVAVLQRTDESEIDVMDLDALTRESVLFYDKELAEQILTLVHCRLDSYFETLKLKARDTFAILQPSNPNVRERKRLQSELDEHQRIFSEKFEEHAFTDELAVYEVDTTGDGVANCKVVPFLQLLGVIPPFYVVGDEIDPFTRKENMERLIAYVTAQAKKISQGKTVLQKYHVAALLQVLTDHVGDGRVDHIWWSAFQQVCKDIYILSGSDPEDKNRYPIQIADVAREWTAEVINSDIPLMMVERIEDVVLAKLMTRRGKKKLWREGLVLLARHLHLWPEIPFDDTVVEVASKGTSCEVLNIVSSMVKPARYLHPELKGVVEDYKQDKPNPPVVGKTPIYKDEAGLVFADMGDFGPENGFAMLWHQRSELTKPSSKPWVTVSWDKDALSDLTEPPYPGPLMIYIVFMNVNPTDKHAERPWLAEQGWQQVEGKRIPVVERAAKLQSDEDMGRRKSLRKHIRFPTDNLRKLPGNVKPKIEVYRKSFSFNGQECKAELWGMGCLHAHRDEPIDPVFVFFQVQRLQMPDAQSFDDAHFAPFTKSGLFKDIWEFYDKAEVIRSPPEGDRKSLHTTSTDRPFTAQSDPMFSNAKRDDSQPGITTENTGMLGVEDISGKTMALLKRTNPTGCIDLTPDSPELLRFIFLRRYHLKRAPEACKKNTNLTVVSPEQMRLGLSRQDRHTGKSKPFFLQPLQQDFFFEDLSFVELDTAEFKEYKFETVENRDGDVGDRVQTRVAAVGLLYKGKLVGQKESSQSHGNRDPGPVIISFKVKTLIDQLNVKTLGCPDDPVRWRISGRNGDNNVGWVTLFERETQYPLDPKPELIEVGKRQSGSIWHRQGTHWLRLRGLWFDAFHELLGALDMRVDRAAAWSLWRLILSRKHKPVVFQSHPGFVSIAQVREAISSLMEQEAFLSDDLFGLWNVESRLGLEAAYRRKMYAGICAVTPDFHGAANLVRWQDLGRVLTSRILRSKPFLERSSSKTGPSAGKQYIIGSLWFEVLYQIVISSMPERYSREEVRQHYDAYSNPRTGLLSMDRAYDVIAKLGRPGLKFVDFSRFISTLGMQISRNSLRLAFNRVDIDQSFTLDADDMQCGITLLLRQVLPKQVLQMAGISTEQIVLHVAFWLMVLFIVFFFLILSFVSLLNGNSNMVVSGLQSIVAGLAGIGVTSEGSKDVKQEDIDELVAQSMEMTLGSSGRRAAQESGSTSRAAE